MKPVIIGTAGHIDHGKTSLVKALTGTDTDRLKEEQERGITIELGYAFVDENIAMIDVPGHERFIKNMVAGVATVDFALLVVAADDGIMPQTREHFDILDLLGVQGGMVAVTKCALAEEDWIDLVEEEIRDMVTGSFMDGCTIVRTDSLSGRGVEEVRSALKSMAGTKPDKPPGAFFRLPIDRAFSVKGFGTVVTGSALSGSVAVEDKLELLPDGKEVRVRGIESRGENARTASAGMRAAINLPQVGVEEISRGDVLASPGRLRPTFMLDAECRVLSLSPVPLEQRQRIRLHVGTKELMARVVILEGDRLEPGEEGLVQFRLEEKVAVQRLDRYVIRRYSPQVTIGGGRILDANPTKHRKRHAREVVSALKELGDAREEQVLKGILAKKRYVSFDDLVAGAGVEEEKVEDTLGSLIIDGEAMELTAKGTRYICSAEAYTGFEETLKEALAKYHKTNPLRGGAKRGEILSRFKKELPDFLVKHFVDTSLMAGIVKVPSGDLMALSEFQVELTKKQRAALAKMENAINENIFQPPDAGDLADEVGLNDKSARQLLQVLVDAGKVINLEGKIYLSQGAIPEGKRILSDAFDEKPELTMSEVRTALGTSRKYALPLINYFDSNGVTTRKGDVRVKGPKL